MLANGHSKTGITSLYTVTGNGTLPRGHVDLAGTKSLSRGDLELRREQNPYPQYALDNEESKSFDHLMPPNFADDETETQRMIESRSGVNPSEVLLLFFAKVGKNHLFSDGRPLRNGCFSPSRTATSSQILTRQQV